MASLYWVVPGILLAYTFIASIYSWVVTNVLIALAAFWALVKAVFAVFKVVAVWLATVWAVLSSVCALERFVFAIFTNVVALLIDVLLSIALYPQYLILFSSTNWDLLFSL